MENNRDRRHGPHATGQEQYSTTPRQLYDVESLTISSMARSQPTASLFPAQSRRFDPGLTTGSGSQFGSPGYMSQGQSLSSPYGDYTEFLGNANVVTAGSQVYGHRNNVWSPYSGQNESYRAESYTVAYNSGNTIGTLAASRHPSRQEDPWSPFQETQNSNFNGYSTTTSPLPDPTAYDRSDRPMSSATSPRRRRSATTATTNTSYTQNSRTSRLAERDHDVPDPCYCQHCPDKAFTGSDRVSNRQRHVREVHKNVRVQCPRCGQEFTRKTAVARHLKEKKETCKASTVAQEGGAY